MNGLENAFEAARQWLFAMPDGRTVQNRMSIRKSGILVARMRETITRRD